MAELLDNLNLFTLDESQSIVTTRGDYTQTTELILFRFSGSDKAIAMLKRSAPYIEVAWRGYVIVDGIEYAAYEGVADKPGGIGLVLYSLKHLYRTGRLQRC